MGKNRTVGYQVRKLANLINRYIDSFHLHEDVVHKTTKVQGWIIGYIYDNSDKDVFQKDIESEFEMRRSTATEILQLMEKNGVIIRESVAYDARLKKITLTDTAIQEHLVISRKLSTIESGMTEGIPPEKMDIFFEVINDIRNNIMKKEELQ